MIIKTLQNRYVVIFLLSMVVRYFFAYFSGISNFQHPDWPRYDMQSNNILAGNFNLETKLFITAPLFSYFLAGMKLCFKSDYPIALEAFQIIASSLSVIFLVKTARIWFEINCIDTLSGILYAIYPITMYYTHQFSQESIFQSSFIISIYYCSRFVKYSSKRDLIKFSIIFSLSLMAKSHIIFIVPFIICGFFLKKLESYSVAIFLGIILLATIPYGLYNKIVNGTYVIASSGLGGMFVTGHNDDFYNYVIAPPLPESSYYKKLKNMDFDVYRRLEPEMTGMSHQQKQMRYLEEGIKWLFDNPYKTFRLLLVNLTNYICPGFNIDHYPYRLWLITYILSFPVFVLAYFEITRRVKEDYKNHLVILSIFSGMLCFALIFYTQNRFRVVTIEPFYLLYACSGVVHIFSDSVTRKNK
ncbi:glycosyltransferase family 39 protein [Desulfobulbus sp. F4]|nr:glycosyltransferase family 39 protein [Desulfobulbus sp. F4]